MRKHPRRLGRSQNPSPQDSTQFKTGLTGAPFVAESGDMIPSAGPLNPQGSGHAANASQDRGLPSIVECRNVTASYCDHGDGAIRRRDLAQPLHHARSLTEHADAGVGVEQVGHGGGLQGFHGRQLPLVGP